MICFDFCRFIEGKNIFIASPFMQNLLQSGLSALLEQHYGLVKLLVELQQRLGYARLKFMESSSNLIRGYAEVYEFLTGRRIYAKSLEN